MILKSNGSRILRERKTGGHADKTIVYVSGNFDGASAYLVYFDDFKQPIKLQNGKLESGKQYTVFDGLEVPLNVVVENAGLNTNISIITSGIS